MQETLRLVRDIFKGFLFMRLAALGVLLVIGALILLLFS
jgi:hypothetical protein